MKEFIKSCNYCKRRTENPPNLKLYQINLEEAIYLCPEEECVYPLPEKNIHEFIIKKYISSVSPLQRKVNETFEPQEKPISSNNISTMVQQSSPKTPLDLPITSEVFNASCNEDYVSDLEKLFGNLDRYDLDINSAELVVESPFDVLNTLDSSLEDIFTNFSNSKRNSPITVKISPVKIQGIENVSRDLTKEFFGDHNAQNLPSSLIQNLKSSLENGNIVFHNGKNCEKSNKKIFRPEKENILPSVKSYASNANIVTDSRCIPSSPQCVSIKYPIWKYKTNLCWLDASLSLLVHNKKLQTFFKSNNSRKCHLEKVLKDYELVLKHVNSLFQNSQDEKLKHSPIKMCNKILEDIRESTLSFLQPLMKCEKDEGGTPVFAVPLLLKENKAVKDLFVLDYKRELKCESCSAFKTDLCKKVMLTFPNAGPNFTLPEGFYLDKCFNCNVPNQRMFLNFEKFPESILMHFVNGLPDNKVSSYDFMHVNHWYQVTGVVQHSLKPQHFVTWIRNPTDESWLCCDDFKLQGDREEPVLQKYSFTSPAIPASELYILMWERSDTLFNGKQKNVAVMMPTVCKSENGSSHSNHVTLQPVVMTDDTNNSPHVIEPSVTSEPVYAEKSSSKVAYTDTDDSFVNLENIMDKNSTLNNSENFPTCTEVKNLLNDFTGTQVQQLEQEIENFVPSSLSMEVLIPSSVASMLPKSQSSNITEVSTNALILSYSHPLVNKPLNEKTAKYQASIISQDLSNRSLILPSSEWSCITDLKKAIDEKNKLVSLKTFSESLECNSTGPLIKVAGMNSGVNNNIVKLPNFESSFKKLPSLCKLSSNFQEQCRIGLYTENIEIKSKENELNTTEPNPENNEENSTFGLFFPTIEAKPIFHVQKPLIQAANIPDAPLEAEVPNSSSSLPLKVAQIVENVKDDSCLENKCKVEDNSLIEQCCLSSETDLSKSKKDNKLTEEQLESTVFVLTNNITENKLTSENYIENITYSLGKERLYQSLNSDNINIPNASEVLDKKRTKFSVDNEMCPTHFLENSDNASNSTEDDCNMYSSPNNTQVCGQEYLLFRKPNGECTGKKEQFDLYNSLEPNKKYSALSTLIPESDVYNEADRSNHGPPIVPVLQNENDINECESKNWRELIAENETNQTSGQQKELQIIEEKVEAKVQLLPEEMSKLEECVVPCEKTLEFKQPCFTITSQSMTKVAVNELLRIPVSQLLSQNVSSNEHSPSKNLSPIKQSLCQPTTEHNEKKQPCGIKRNTAKAKSEEISTFFEDSLQNDFKIMNEVSDMKTISLCLPSGELAEIFNKDKKCSKVNFLKTGYNGNEQNSSAVEQANTVKFLFSSELKKNGFDETVLKTQELSAISSYYLSPSSENGQISNELEKQCNEKKCIENGVIPFENSIQSNISTMNENQAVVATVISYPSVNCVNQLLPEASIITNGEKSVKVIGEMVCSSKSESPMPQRKELINHKNNSSIPSVKSHHKLVSEKYISHLLLDKKRFDKKDLKHSQCNVTGGIQTNSKDACYSKDTASKTEQMANVELLPAIGETRVYKNQREHQKQRNRNNPDVQNRVTQSKRQPSALLNKDLKMALLDSKQLLHGISELYHSFNVEQIFQNRKKEPSKTAGKRSRKPKNNIRSSKSSFQDAILNSDDDDDPSFTKIKAYIEKLVGASPDVHSEALMLKAKENFKTVNYAENTSKSFQSTAQKNKRTFRGESFLLNDHVDKQQAAEIQLQEESKEVLPNIKTYQRNKKYDASVNYVSFTPQNKTDFKEELCATSNPTNPPISIYDGIHPPSDLYQLTTLTSKDTRLKDENLISIDPGQDKSKISNSTVCQNGYCNLQMNDALENEQNISNMTSLCICSENEIEDNQLISERKGNVKYTSIKQKLNECTTPLKKNTIQKVGNEDESFKCISNIKNFIGIDNPEKQYFLEIKSKQDIVKTTSRIKNSDDTGIRKVETSAESLKKNTTFQQRKNASRKAAKIKHVNCNSMNTNIVTIPSKDNHKKLATVSLNKELVRDTNNTVQSPVILLENTGSGNSVVLCHKKKIQTQNKKKLRNISIMGKQIITNDLKDKAQKLTMETMLCSVAAKKGYRRRVIMNKTLSFSKVEGKLILPEYPGKLGHKPFLQRKRSSLSYTALIKNDSATERKKKYIIPLDGSSANNVETVSVTFTPDTSSIIQSSLPCKKLTGTILDVQPLNVINCKKSNCSNNNSAVKKRKKS